MQISKHTYRHKYLYNKIRKTNSRALRENNKNGEKIENCVLRTLSYMGIGMGRYGNRAAGRPFFGTESLLGANRLWE